MYQNFFKICGYGESVLLDISTKQINKVYYSTSTKPIINLRLKRKVIPFSGWLLLSIPVASCALGVWQIRRKQWKEGLIADLRKRSDCNPIDLPSSLEEIRQLEFRPVRVKGTFLHDKEIYIGPRTFLSAGDASTKSSLMTAKSKTGYLVITPFKLENNDKIILINRGWVQSKEKNPKTRAKGQIEGVTDVIGLLRLNEPRPQFSIKNQEGSNIYFYRDLEKMAERTGASPIFLDATNDCDVPGGPIGGQTRTILRNEHLSYILTWFTLSGATSYMWYMKFLK